MRDQPPARLEECWLMAMMLHQTPSVAGNEGNLLAAGTSMFGWSVKLQLIWKLVCHLVGPLGRG